jgi:hypothetical protein
MNATRAWRWLGGSAAASVVAIGLLHASALRPVMALVGGGCPMRATAADVERAREAVARAERTDRAARDRFALAFRLDGTTLEDARAWADARRISCNVEASGTVLRCDGVSARALGDASGVDVDELVLAFAPSGKLVNVSAWRRSLAPDTAETALRAIRDDLAARLGEPTRAAADRTALAYRFRDYAADVSTAEIPGRGVFVREHYMSAAD